MISLFVTIFKLLYFLPYVGKKGETILEYYQLIFDSVDVVTGK